jgi:hypothetical protein
MNETYLSGEDQRLLDLLVDGELNDAERRELLLRLDRSPDGWRRCAAAFLEAQAWRGEARALVAAEPVHPQLGNTQPGRLTPASAVRRPSDGRVAVQIWLPLALAAGLLVATTWVFWNQNQGGLGSAGSQQAGNQTDSAAQVAENSNHGPTAPGINGADPTIPRNLQLVVNGGPEGRRNVEVPLVEPDEMDQALFGPWTPALPPEVIRMLEQNGHQVVRQRQLVPVDLGDGRRVVLPMDQVEIRPVNTQSFQ